MRALKGGRLPALTVAALSLVLGSRAGAAIDLTSAEGASGSWVVSLQDTERKCTLLLRNENRGPGRWIGMTAGCRRALPALTDVGAWNLSRDQQLTLSDARGAPVLSFAPNGETLLATGPEGETYELVPADSAPREQFAQAGAGGGFRSIPPAPGPADITPAAVTRIAVPAPPAPDTGLSPIKPTPVAGKPASAAAAPAATTPPSEPQGGPVVAFPGRQNDLAGRYVILREGGKDVGCMLTLDDKARGPGGLKAQLAPACRDQGIVVFDPVGWHFDRGHMVLTARKGHSARFEWHADGAWWKDPKEGGKPLGVKKL